MDKKSNTLTNCKNRIEARKLICLLLNIVVISWYIIGVHWFKIENIGNLYLRFLFVFIPILVALVFTIYILYKSIRKKESKNFFCDTFLNSIFVICIILHTSISGILLCILLLKRYYTYTIMYIAVLIFILYILDLLIRKVVKMTYSVLFSFIGFLFFLGWLSINEIGLLSLFSGIFNIIVSSDDRKKLSIFFQNKDIKLCLFSLGDINNPNIDGKIVAQKIMTYIFIIFFYLIMRLTENNYFNLKIYCYLISIKVSEATILQRYIFKGADRALILFFIILVLLCHKKTNKILMAIFSKED